MTGKQQSRSMVVLLGVTLLAVTVMISQVGYAATKITLTHMHYYWHGDPWGKYIEEAAEKFMQENPGVEIKVITVGDREAYPTKVSVMAAAGMAPDITEMHQVMAGPFMAQGFFLDLRPFMQKDRDVRPESFTPSSIKGFTWTDGSIFALPAEVDTDVTFFNIDMIEEAGLLTPVQLGKKWNWDAVVSMGRKLTVDKNGDGQTDQYGIDRPWALWFRGAVQQQAGAPLYNRLINPTESRFNLPQVETALQFVADLYLKSKLSLPYADPKESQYYMWLGKSAIMMANGGPGLVSKFFTDVDFKWGVCLHPAGPAGTGTRAVPSGWQISKYCKHPEVAWKWIRYLATDEKSVQAFVRATSRLPALLSVQEKLGKSWHVFIEAANHPNTIPGYVLPRAAEIDPIVSTLVGKVFRGQISAHEALQQIHRQVSEILKRK